MRVIGEFKGKQDLCSERFPEVLKRLQELAIIQSTESSNRLEGVTAPPDRLRELRPRRPPANRLRGGDRRLPRRAGHHPRLARDVKIRPDVILQLHRDLYKFSAGGGGQGKQVENEIADVHADGTRTTRFRCVRRAHGRLDGAAVRRLQPAVAPGGREPLLLIPAFILDFLCIHPFRDGNGRMARLLTLLLLYEAGYEVGRYVSLERIIEESKESYYDALKAPAKAGTRGSTPFRPGGITCWARSWPPTENWSGGWNWSRRFPGKRTMVQDAINHFQGEFTIKDVERACPTVGRDMIRLVLKELRAEGKIEPLGKGRGSKWRRMG